MHIFRCHLHGHAVYCACWLAGLWILLSPMGRGSVPAFGASANVAIPSDQPWITYRQHKYLLSDLTDVPFVEVKSVLQKNVGPIVITDSMKRRWLFPGTSPWAPQEGGNGVNYFQHQADGVFELFLCGRVMDAFEKRYDIKQNNIYDIGKLSGAITLQAEIMGRFQRQMARLLSDNVNRNTAALTLGSEFPNAHFAPGVWLGTFNDYKEMQSCALINFACFPPLTKQGKVSPWFRDYLRTAAFRYELKSVIDANKQQVIADVDRSMGTIVYLIIKNADINDLTALGKLTDLLTDKSGAIAQGGLDRANSLLATMGARTKIECVQGTRQLLAKSYKIDESDLLPRKFTDIHGHNLNDDYVFIVTGTAGHALADYPTGAGNFAYDRGVADFVVPIINEVLKSTDVSPGSHLPSAGQLARHASIGIINVDGLFGEHIPNPFKHQ